MSDQTKDTTAVDEAAQADREALAEAAGRDGGPQDEKDMQAADGLTADASVSEEYADMLERGAQQHGEGRVP
jgi:hypothetical protein